MGYPEAKDTLKTWSIQRRKDSLKWNIHRHKDTAKDMNIQTPKDILKNVEYPETERNTQKHGLSRGRKTHSETWLKLRQKDTLRDMKYQETERHTQRQTLRDQEYRKTDKHS